MFDLRSITIYNIKFWAFLLLIVTSLSVHHSTKLFRSFCKSCIPSLSLLCEIYITISSAYKDTLHEFRALDKSLIYNRNNNDTI